MRKELAAVILVNALFLGVGWSQDQAKPENNVIVGPGFQKDQQSQMTLVFAVPPGWVRDEAGAKKLGFYGVLVPAGSTLEHAEKEITIEFQRKDPHTPGMENLENFARDDFKQTLAQFPEAQFARWQPHGLNPDKIKFFSIEMFGKKKNQPSPQHYVILDSGDGFFSISLTAKTREELQSPIYEDFFNSIDLAQKK